MDPTVLVAIVVAAVVAGVVAGRLQRMAKRNPRDPAAPVVVDSTLPLSTEDQRFRLLSFQGGSVPADLGPMLEELRRNGIEVDEETLRRKLAEGVAVAERAAAEAAEEQRGRTTLSTATVLEAADEPSDGEPAPHTVLVQVTLELRLPGGDPVTERRVALIPEDKRGLLSAGAAVPVRYDPEDPRAMTLEWEIT